MLLAIGVWVGLWVFIGYFVAAAMDEEPNIGMIYAATLGPLGIALLLVGHFATSKPLEIPDSSQQNIEHIQHPPSMSSIDDPLL
jgi:hypothetical protein